MTPIATRPQRGHYSESEAAVALGVSVDDLRTLIRSQILRNEDDPNHVPSATFQPSDLLVLRMLLNGVRPVEPATAVPETVHSASA